VKFERGKFPKMGKIALILGNIWESFQAICLIINKEMRLENPRVGGSIPSLGTITSVRHCFIILFS